jgi:hypothetical protein
MMGLELTTFCIGTERTPADRERQEPTFRVAEPLSPVHGLHARASRRPSSACRTVSSGSASQAAIAARTILVPIPCRCRSGPTAIGVSVTTIPDT